MKIFPFLYWPANALIVVLIVVVLYTLFRYIDLLIQFIKVRYRYPLKKYYTIKNKKNENFRIILVTAPESVIDGLEKYNSVIYTLLGVRLTKKDHLSFSIFQQAWKTCPDFPPDLVIARYIVRGLGPNIEKAYYMINEYLKQEKQMSRIDPNWIIGQPFEAEGSPFEAEGSPFNGNARTPPQPACVATRGEFTGQSAFTQMGLKQMELPALKSVKKQPECIVRVGVFDSSPFPRPQNLTDDTPEDVYTFEGKRLYCKFYPEPIQVDTSEKPFDGMNQHGFFAAGLIANVAPDCELHLVEVLDDQNRGDLFYLVNALYKFLEQAYIKDKGKLSGVVINLSLCVRIPPAQAQIHLPTEVNALRYIISAAHCLGAVVVAAAGNTSFDDILPEPSGIPGLWNAALSVASNNKYGERSCFSNEGKVAAPGGDGRPTQVSKEPGCVPRTNVIESDAVKLLETSDTARVKQAIQSAASEVGVIGPIYTGIGQQVNPQVPAPINVEYTYWAGTSFAAPLVSGLAALLLQKYCGAPNYLIEKIILGTAKQNDNPALGAGIIQVDKALN